ncbi:ThiF family adenylyltransferase [Frankia sp. AiPa1]|uniref:ThiF family adenylyltransferase n=1 Tax=Frankia sp. AiPa1 TaxID=573492 RepID=UPI00202B4AA9|nr:ThiF family adenylyltransferase [Frankia sp. AiPa1]MCL9758398.1 ThiF family adenylyltransferase [Frankia sp. AiPa1]
MHPILKPGLRRLWHNGSTLQLGIDPARAVVVTGLQPAHTALLDALDGHRTLEQVRADSGPAGRDLLDLLDAAGMLADAAVPSVAAPDPAALARLAEALGAPGRTGLPGPTGGREPSDGAGLSDSSGLSAPPGTAEQKRLLPDLAALSLRSADPARPSAVLRARRAARVVVRGAGRVGAQIAALLAAAGIGRIVIDDSGVTTAADIAPGGLRLADVGRPRALAVGGALARIGHNPTGQLPSSPRGPAGGGHGPRRSSLPAFDADFVVLAPIGPPTLAPGAALELEQLGRAHLIAGVQETSGIVGPLVVPGLTACLHCQHLHRHTRDPAWPLLAMQLVRPHAAGDDPCEITLASLVAALAAMQSLDYLDAAMLIRQSGGVNSRQVTATTNAETNATFYGAGPLLPATANGTLEFAAPGWRVRRRSWPVHPNCPCRTARSAARAATGATGAAGLDAPDAAGGGDRRGRPVRRSTPTGSG